MAFVKLNFDFRDLLLAPRLALSGKKILIFIKGNIAGYISYWFCSLLSLASSKMSIEEIIFKYGLYPSLFGHSAEWYSWLIYLIGITLWSFSILLSSTAVSRITLKQLKGNEFYSGSESWAFATKNWQSVVLSPFAILIIIIFFLILAFIFSLVGKLLFIGDIIFSLSYIILFLGGIFTLLTVLVLISSVLYTPSIIGMYEEDVLGSVFHSYSITFSQIWRIIVYNILLFSMTFIGLEIYSWFTLNSIGLINYIFGHDLLLGEKFNQINSYALNLVLPDFIYERLFDIKQNILEFFRLDFAIPHIFSLKNEIVIPTKISSVHTFAGILLSLSYFIIGLSILSYGLSIIFVGESLMFITFKKLSDDDNLILRKDSDEIEEEKREKNGTDINILLPTSSNEEE